MMAMEEGDQRMEEESLYQSILEDKTTYEQEKVCTEATGTTVS